MADDKKDKKKDAVPSSAFSDKHYEEVLYFVLPGLIILGILINRLMAYVNRLNVYSNSSFWSETYSWLLKLWHVWKPIAVILTGAGIVWGVYSFLNLKRVEKEKEKIFGTPQSGTSLEATRGKSQKRADTWSGVLTHAHSNNPALWRVAIIEADTMLEEVLRSAGYHGEGVGELLKSVDPTDLLTLDAAWEAHKIRNRIAHSGQAFDLTERETRRIIALFESVFREFEVI